MIQDITTTLATADNFENVTALLQAQKLPAQDLPATLENFIVAKENGKLIGSVGLQIYKPFALLRSLALESGHQNKGLGKILYKAAHKLALDSQVQELFLITTTAAPFFERLGFSQIERHTVPAAIGATAQFSSICPASGIVMWRRI